MNNTSLAATAPDVIVNDSCEIEVESAAERVVNIVGYSVIIPVSIYIGNTLLPDVQCNKIIDSTPLHTASL